MKKSYVCSDKTDKDIKKCAEEFELSDNLLIDVAVKTFVSFPENSRRILLAYYYVLLGKEISPSIVDINKSDIQTIFETVVNYPKKKNAKEQSG